MRRLSVIITNYNYEKYVAEAIDSALNLIWHDLEVIVIDDGSQDNSRAVIDKYRSRICYRYIANSGQRVATNVGYSLSTGDVVIFLDSDDVLPRSLPIHLSSCWTEHVSKAQFRMQRIDELGRPFGRPFPTYTRRSTPENIRRWAASTSAYPTPPGSANAYSRSFLDQIFPIGDELGDAADSACLAAAPFFGEVVAVPNVLVGYRRHGDNDSNLLREPGRFAREVERARDRWCFACRVRDQVPDGKVLFRSRELLQLRTAASRMGEDPFPLEGDSRRKLLWDTLMSPLQIGPESVSRRLAIMLWCLVTALAPRGVADRLLRYRYRTG